MSELPLDGPRARSLAPPRELTDRLSTRAAAKLRRIVAEAEEAADLARSAVDRASDASDTHRAAAERLRVHKGAHLPWNAQGRTFDASDLTAEEHGGTGGRGTARVVRPNAEHVKKLEEDVAQTLEERDRRRTEAEAPRERSGDARSTLSGVVRYLTVTRDEGLTDATLPAVKRGDLGAQIAAARRAVDELRAERKATRDAPCTDAELLASISAEVKALAVAGRPHASLTAEGSITWPRADARVSALAGTAVGVSTPDTLAVLAWLDGPRLVERLHGDALERLRGSGVKPGLPRPERDAAIARLDLAILDAERLEEAVVEALLAAGTVTARRPDADPRAVLGVTGPAPKS